MQAASAWKMTCEYISINQIITQSTNTECTDNPVVGRSV
uniref:Uncharacterized protein n=1 Tax=Rhizophora mucronata TaxID=61149 RepID=A0A2P2P7E2_RHIMU